MSLKSYFMIFPRLCTLPYIMVGQFKVVCTSSQTPLMHSNKNWATYGEDSIDFVHNQNTLAIVEVFPHLTAMGDLKKDPIAQNWQGSIVFSPLLTWQLMRFRSTVFASFEPSLLANQASARFWQSITTCNAPGKCTISYFSMELQVTGHERNLLDKGLLRR